MTKRLEIGIATIAVIVALVTLLFGDNIYQQITGRSWYERVQPILATETPSTLDSSPTNEPPVVSTTPTSIAQTSIESWILGELIYEENFEDELISGLKTKLGKFDIVVTNDGNHVWRTATSSLSQVSLPTTSSDYAVEAKIMQVSSQQGFGFIEIRTESGEPCNAGYEIYLDAYGDWLNLIERGHNCEELREDGLFANRKTSLSTGVWYTVRIEAKGAEVRVYLNENLVAQDKDIDGTIRNSSTIGFSTCCGDLEPFVFDFDDIKVWLLSP